MTLLNEIDTQGNQKISREEWLFYFNEQNHEVGDLELMTEFNAFDRNQDGEATFEEICQSYTVVYYSESDFE